MPTIRRTVTIRKLFASVLVLIVGVQSCGAQIVQFPQVFAESGADIGTQIIQPDDVQTPTIHTEDTLEADIIGGSEEVEEMSTDNLGVDGLLFETGENLVPTGELDFASGSTALESGSLLSDFLDTGVMVLSGMGIEILTGNVITGNSGTVGDTTGQIAEVSDDKQEITEIVGTGCALLENGFDINNCISTHVEGGTDQYCSLITKSNLSRLTGLPERIGVGDSGSISMGDAITLLRSGISHNLMTKLESCGSLEQILKDSPKGSLVDVFLYKENLDAAAGSPEYYNQAHRFVALLGEDGHAYVLDPIRGSYVRTPQLLEEYRRKACVDQDVYMFQTIYQSLDADLIEEEIIGTSGSLITSPSIVFSNGKLKLKLVETAIENKIEGEILDSEIATEEILKVLTSEEDVVLELEAKIAQQGLDKGVITAGKKKQLIGEIIEQRVDAMDASSIVLTTIIDDQGNREEATTSFEVGSVRLVVTPQRQLQPGIYTLELLITNPITQKTQTITQNFEWGVLAINPDKDVYLHNENGVLNIGVLDSTGMPTCDAEVVLDVIRPDGTTTTLDVRTTPDCGVMEPGLIVSDYMSEIYFYQTGIYTLVLRATTDDGVHTLTQEVQVQDNPLFVVTRHSATRLYPVAPVMMQLSILFYEDFEGDISDFVPSSFFISPSESYITQELDNREIQIIWKSIRAQSGERVDLEYEFDAPDISPEFYIIGPLQLDSTGAYDTLQIGQAPNRIDTTEQRVWQIANDLPGSVTGTIYRFKTDTGAYTNAAGTAPATNGAAVRVRRNAATNANVPLLQQSTAARRPIFRDGSSNTGLNFHPSIHQSTGRRLQSASSTLTMSQIVGATSGLTSYAVFKETLSQSQFGVVDSNALNPAYHIRQNGLTLDVDCNNGTFTTLQASVSGSPKLLSTQWGGGSGSASNLVFDRGLSASVTVNDIPASLSNAAQYRSVVGQSCGGLYNEQTIVNEIIVYPTIHNAIQRNRIESYLASKWGFTLGTTANPISYSSATGTVYRSGSTIYQHRITVIGRDDGSPLLQKQSKSVEAGALVTMGLGAIASSNATNTNTFGTDNSYLAFGDDNGSISAWTAVGAPSGYKILPRTWMVQGVGNVGQVKIQVPDDTSVLSDKLPTDSGQVYMLVDTDSDFSNGGNTLYPMLLSGTDRDPLVTLSSGLFFTFAMSSQIVNLTITSTGVAEAGGSTRVIASISGGFTALTGIVVTILRTGTATVGVDYTLTGTITIPFGATSGSIILTGIADLLIEGNESFIVAISAITNATTGVDTVSGWVIDDEIIVTKAFGKQTGYVNESVPLVFTFTSSGGNLVSGIRLTDNFPNNLIIGSGASSHTCTSGFIQRNNGAALVAGATGVRLTGFVMTGGMTSCTVTVRVKSLFSGSYTNSGNNITGTTNIINGVTGQTIWFILPEVLLTFSTGNLAEQSGMVIVTLSLSGGVTATTGIAITLLYSGNATSGVDYTGHRTSVVIVSGASSTGFVITGRADLIAEGDETIVININTVTNAIEAGQQSGTITVIDDEILLTKAFGQQSGYLGQAITLTFTLTNNAGIVKSGIRFTDNFPNNLIIVNTTTSTTCSSGLIQNNLGGALAVGSTGVRLTGFVMTGGMTSCTVSVNVSSYTSGLYVNSGNNITGTNNIINNVTGQNVRFSVICGDGVISIGEQCDDSNTGAGDGCNASCKIESGYSCYSQPSICAIACGQPLDYFAYTGSYDIPIGRLARGTLVNPNMIKLPTYTITTSVVTASGAGYDSYMTPTGAARVGGPTPNEYLYTDVLTGGFINYTLDRDFEGNLIFVYNDVNSLTSQVQLLDSAGVAVDSSLLSIEQNKGNLNTIISKSYNTGTKTWTIRHGDENDNGYVIRFPAYPTFRTLRFTDPSTFITDGGIFIAQFINLDVSDDPSAYSGYESAGHQQGWCGTGPVLGTTVTVDVFSGYETLNAYHRHLTSARATGDTDDGVTTMPQLISGATTYTLPIALTTLTTAYISAWMDYDLDGDYEIGERVQAVLAPGATSVVLTWTGLTNVLSGITYNIRVRISSYSGDIVTPSGVARDGEVESYQIIATPASTIGDFVRYDMNGNGVQNVGEFGISGVVVSLYLDNGDNSLNTGTDTLIGTRTTSITGYYLFTGLISGTYFVDVGSVTGMILTTNNDPQTIVATGRIYTGADFGFIPQVIITVDTGQILEASGVAVFRVGFTGGFVAQTGVTVTLLLSGTATSGIDFTGGLTLTVTIPMGQTGVNFLITGRQDLVIEGTETVQFTINTVTNATGGSPNTQLVNIIDDDMAIVNLTGGTTIFETGGTDILRVYLSGGLITLSNITVTLVLSGTASGSDYTGISTTITILSGTSGTNIGITAVQDLIFEGTEILITTLVFATGGGATGSTTMNATTTIIVDDDTTPQILLTGSTGQIVEASGSVLMRVYISGGVTSTTGIIVTLTYAGTALSGTDYTGVVLTVTIPAGQTGANFTLSALQDIIFEGNETVVVAISGVINGTEFGTQQHTTTILDDETTPQILLTINTGQVAEASGSAVLMIYTSGGVTSTTGIIVTLTYAGTAISGTDYSGTTITVTIPAGQTGISFTLTALQDLIREGNETIIIDIDTVTNATELATQQQTITIIDDETIPAIAIVIFDPTNCDGHIWGGIFDPTNTHIVRVRVYSGAALIHKRVPPLTSTGAFYIYPNYTDPFSTGGYTGYIGPGIYTVIYGGETTGGVEVVSGTYTSFLGKSCPTSNGGGGVLRQSNQDITGENILEEVEPRTSSDDFEHMLATRGKRILKLLDSKLFDSFDIVTIHALTDKLEDIVGQVNTLPSTGVELGRRIRGLVQSITFKPESSFILPKTGADTDLH